MTTAPAARSRDARQNAVEATDHVCSPAVLEPEKKDFACSILERCGNLSEVEIRRQYNAVFRQSLLENLAVRHPVQAFVAEMNGIVALAPEPIRNADVNVHVHQDAYDRLRILHALLGQPRRVLDGLLDVVSFEIGVANKDLIKRCTVRDLADNH